MDMQRYQQTLNASGQSGQSQADEQFLQRFVNQGHAHSDADDERDGNPWDELNKVDKMTSIEDKLAKKLNQFPYIDLHSRTPYLDDKDESKDKQRDDPKTLLHKQVCKEHRK